MSQALQQHLTSLLGQAELPDWHHQIREHWLDTHSSEYTATPSSQEEIEYLACCYLDVVFGGTIDNALNGIPLNFQASKRLTRAAGKTTVTFQKLTKKPKQYTIAIGTFLISHGFSQAEQVTINGLVCQDPLAATQRVIEHELVHLIEFLLHGRSACGRKRFQTWANKLFGHTAHQHELTRPVQTAKQSGFHIGAKVQFQLDGEIQKGIINRVTKRATVLVPNKRGQKFSDGKRYDKYYIPLSDLKLI